MDNFECIVPNPATLTHHLDALHNLSIRATVDVPEEVRAKRREKLDVLALVGGEEVVTELAPAIDAGLVGVERNSAETKIPICSGAVLPRPYLASTGGVVLGRLETSEHAVLTRCLVVRIMLVTMYLGILVRNTCWSAARRCNRRLGVTVTIDGLEIAQLHPQVVVLTLELVDGDVALGEPSAQLTVLNFGGEGFLTIALDIVPILGLHDVQFIRLLLVSARLLVSHLMERHLFLIEFCLHLEPQPLLLEVFLPG